MPTTPDPEAHELDPGSLPQDKCEKRYIALYCGDDEKKAYDAISDEAPQEYDHPNGDTLPLEGIELDPYSGNGIWYGKATYSAKQGEQAPSESGSGDTSADQPQPPANNADVGGSISFTTTGGTIHNTLSKETVQSVKAGGGNPPDNKLAVGVHGDSDQIDGYDAVAPKLEITIKQKLRQVTPAYLQVLRDLTGTVNNAKFLRFEAGEVLFMGATGESTNQGWDVTYTFAISKNEATVDCGNGMTLTNKKGWYYVWVGYSPATSNNALTKQPIYAYLERVYDTTDFSRLGIYAAG